MAYGWTSTCKVLLLVGVTMLSAPAVTEVFAAKFDDKLYSSGQGGTFHRVTACLFGRQVCDSMSQMGKANVSGKLDADLLWRIGVYAGQPTVAFALNWQPRTLEGILPPEFAKADPIVYAGQSDKYNNELILYDVMVGIHLTYQGRLYGIIGPVRTANVPSKWSLYQIDEATNVFNWDQFITDENDNYVSAALAKSIMENAILKPRELPDGGGVLLSARMDTSRLTGIWQNDHASLYNTVLSKAVDERLDLLAQTLGLPVAPIRKGLVDYRRTHDEAQQLAKLYEIYSRLTPDTLPKQYAPTGADGEKSMRAYRTGFAALAKTQAVTLRALPPLPTRPSADYMKWETDEKGRRALNQKRLEALKLDVKSAQAARDAQYAENQRRAAAARQAEIRAREEREREEERQETRRRQRDYDDIEPSRGSDWDSITGDINNAVQDSLTMICQSGPYAGQRVYSESQCWGR